MFNDVVCQIAFFFMIFFFNSLNMFETIFLSMSGTAMSYKLSVILEPAYLFSTFSTTVLNTKK